MDAMTVEVVEVRPAGDYPWPTILGTIVHGPDAGTVVQAAADTAEALAIVDALAELGAMPPVALVERWQIVAAGLRTCDGCGAIDDAGTGPDLDGLGYGPCCTVEVGA
jgi:hypothetical protein